MSLNWKIKNQLLELTTIDQNGPSISVIRVDPKSHQIVHAGTNYVGTTTTGKWDFSAREGPKLAASFVTLAGVQGELNMQLVPQRDNAMVLRVGAQQMANVQLMRKPYSTPLTPAFGLIFPDDLEKTYVHTDRRRAEPLHAQT